VYPTVIVIDGLDECLNDKERTILLHAISMAAAQDSVLLKFLITSRPEVPISRVFNVTPVVEVSSRHSLDDEPESIEDVGISCLPNSTKSSAPILRDGTSVMTGHLPRS